MCVLRKSLLIFVSLKFSGEADFRGRFMTKNLNNRASFNKSNHIDRMFGWMVQRNLNGTIF